jgi:uncharacterized damage-inducible protein DinB
MTDPTSARLFRHMAWANARCCARLARLPAAVLGHCAPGNPWSVAVTLHHLVEAAASYAARLDGRPAPLVAPRPPDDHAGLAALAAACAAADARLCAAAAHSDGVVARADAPLRPWARATVLAQAIHHATEHRAQIAGALVAHGVTALDLDGLDVWAYDDAVGPDPWASAADCPGRSDRDERIDAEPSAL